ncbi:UNVERIFIED_CONTAM: hypothetical protein Sradi_1617300 [Sesamum radiatum]|uniref:Uncharacterized protein n=1 Tax=Sesamum radiatum TaxID=300843 RepID=A0AAW2U9Y5_SESRA
MATFQSHLHFLPLNSPKLIHFKNPHSCSFSKKLLLSKTLFSAKKFNGVLRPRFTSYCKASASSSSSAEIEKSVSTETGNERPPFDINLAVILAGFAFEAYTTPPEKVGKREMDAAKCQTVFLSEYVVFAFINSRYHIGSENIHNAIRLFMWAMFGHWILVRKTVLISDGGTLYLLSVTSIFLIKVKVQYSIRSFLREIYDGQLFVKLKKGFNFPAMDPWENVDVLEDGYQGDVIGEATPDVLVSEFMKGEKELVENILNTEINIFRSIRDGSALMQHMEDFYYISLLENVKSNYQTVGGQQPADQKLSI